MSKELCAQLLPAELMRETDARFPDTDWDAMFALIQSRGTSIAEVLTILLGIVKSNGAGSEEAGGRERCKEQADAGSR